jgi:predicted phage terminase large subunit-like protein
VFCILIKLVVDDAINSIDVHSKAARDATWSWFGESFSTRLDGEGSIVVVGQRLGVDDLIGRIRASGATWTCLTLPSEYDPRRRCVVHAIDGSIVWADPRTEEGELLAPAIHSREKLNEQRLAIGSNAFAAQYNQNPSSDETSMAPARWWRFHRQPHTPDGTRRPNGCSDAPAAELPTRFDQIVIAADLTFGAANGDYAVVQAWGSAGGSRFLLRQWRKRAGFDEQVAAIRSMAAEWPPTKVVVERAANGAAVIEALQKFLSCVVPQIPVGSKAQRLAAIVPQLEAGAVHLPEGADFVPDFIDEFRAFPSRHDDQVDCAVWALLAFSSVDPELADKRHTFYRNLGWILSDQYSGAALEEQIQARMDLFDKRHRGEVGD